MRNLFLYIFLLCALGLSAQSRLSGNCYVVAGAQGVDKVVVFENLSAPDAYIAYTGSGSASWTTFSGQSVQSGTGAETLYPQDATGYLLYEDGQLLESFYVLDYQAYKPNLESAVLTADMQCDRTILTLTADIPEMAYYSTTGRKTVIDREAAVRYFTLNWNGKDYTDSTCVELVQLTQGVKGSPLTQTIQLPAIWRNTDFSLSLDAFAEGWADAPDSLLSEEFEAIAVCAHPVSITTSRNYNDRGVENEPSRPIDEGTLQGSAPLEINFQANANVPVAAFYRWRIYKGSELIVERFDETQRYTFMENGAYQVRCWAYNEFCTTDSAVFDINVSESLLRVPNVFTPNGDGTNDEFRVAYRSLAEFHCWVYNRWGKLVYQWDDPAKGWDGNINGHPAAEGAYYYIIRARGTDADADGKYHKVTKKRPADIGIYQISGHINLIRGKK